MNILVVEDEPIVRMGAVMMLADAGLYSIEAANAAEAVRILKQRTDISAVFTDVDMPGEIDGVRLAHLVREQWPHIVVLVTSGKDLPSPLPQDAEFFPKPYDANRIEATIRNRLGIL